MKPFLTEIKFGSLLVYQPRAIDGYDTSLELLNNSALLCKYVKNYHQQTMDRIYEILNEHIENKQELIELFEHDNLTLVPVPGHAPLSDKDAKWNAKLICQELEKLGIGKMSACIERVKKVNKSSTSAPNDRATFPEHYESLKFNQDIFLGENILLVDDVVTRGSTMLAVANRIAEIKPSSKIMGFAILRTMSFEGISDLITSCTGVIKLRQDHQRAYRKP